MKVPLLPLAMPILQKLESVIGNVIPSKIEDTKKLMKNSIVNLILSKSKRKLIKSKKKSMTMDQ